MKILNNSRKIIGIGRVDLLPDACADLPEEFEGNPIIADYIARGILEEINSIKEKGTRGRRKQPKADSSEAETSDDERAEEERQEAEESEGMEL